MYIHEETVRETLPNPSSVSSHNTPPRPEMNTIDTPIGSPSRKRDDAFAENNLVPTEVAPVTCSCLQQLTELLCSFKLAEATEGQSAYDIDTVLRTAQEALRPWQAAIGCPNCAHNNDQEVLQVAFMTIRLVLVRLQNLIPPWSFQDIERKNGTTKKMPQQQQPQRQPADKIWPNYSARVTLGTFEACQADTKVVVQMLLLSTIHRIKAMIISFKETLDRKQKMLQPASRAEFTTTNTRNGKQTRNNVQAEHGNAAHAASNLDHVQHMLQGLASFLQTLERALESEQLEQNGNGRQPTIFRNEGR